MESANFRIIPHRIAIGVPSPENDLYRYLVTYATATPPPSYLVMNGDGSFCLVEDEKEATRFPNMEAAEEARRRMEQQMEYGDAPPVAVDTRDIL